MNVKLFIFIINLIWLTSCVEQVKESVRSLTGSPPASVEDSPASYKPEPPPAMDQDQAIQISPKERTLTLFAQFNRSPDDTLYGLVMSEFTANKALFNVPTDEALKTALNRSITNIQQGDRLTLRLLVQLLPILPGDNKEFLRGVIARGFDSAPGVLSDILARSNEDKLCLIVSLIPPEVTPEAKKDFLENRLNTLLALSGDTTLGPFGRGYADACIRTLQLALNMTPAETNGTAPVAAEPPVAVPDQAPVDAVPAPVTTPVTP